MWPPRLVALVRRFVETDSWAGARVLVEDELRLLTASADGVLADLVAAADLRRDEASRRLFVEHRDALRSVRAEGPAALDARIAAGLPADVRDVWVGAELAHERFRRDPTRSRMDEAVRATAAVVTHPGFGRVDADRRGGMAQAGARAAVRRFEDANVAEDLDRSITMYRLAVDSYPAGHPDRPTCASALGTALCMRYELRGHLPDLHEGSPGPATACRTCPSRSAGSPCTTWRPTPACATNCSATPTTFATPWTPPATPWPPTPPPDEAPPMINNLCNLLLHRFERDGSLDDLAAATELAAAGVRAARRGPGRGALLTTAAAVAVQRFAVVGDVAHLDAAATDLRRAARELGRGSTHLPMCWGTLGSVLLTRWEATGVADDLFAACATLRRAVAGSGREAPRSALLTSLLGLASLHAARAGGPGRTRFGRADPDPLSAAVELLRQAVELAHDAERQQLFARTNLGTGLAARHGRDGDPADLREGNATFRMATTRAATQDPQLALRAAVEWGDWAAERGDWADAMTAYAMGIDAGPALRRRQLARGHKEAWIAIGEGLAEKAATAAVRARRSGDAAVALERSRAQLLGERLSVSTLLLLQLDQAEPPLAVGYRAAAERVRGLEALGGSVLVQPVRNARRPAGAGR